VARVLLGLAVRSALFDLAVAGVVGVLALIELGFGRAPVVVALGLGMATALLVRRRRPIWCFAAVAVLAIVQAALSMPVAPWAEPVQAWRYVAPLPFDVALLIAIYSAVTYASTLRPGAVAGILGIVGALFPSRYAGRDWWRQALLLGAAVVTVWAIGLSTRTRRLYVASLEDRAATAERERDRSAQLAVAQERTRIAREMHDVIAHGLSVMIAQADGASYVLRTDPARAQAALETVAETGREALGDMGRLVAVLRDSDGADAPPTAAPQWSPTLDQLDALVDRSNAAGLDVTLHTTGEPRPVPAGVALAAYRIAQESLTNVLKHVGTGTRVTVVWAYQADAVEVEVTDDGGGGTAAPTTIGSVPGGQGLVGMRERVAVYGGAFSAGPRLAGGWRVSARLPVPRSTSGAVTEELTR